VQNALIFFQMDPRVHPSDICRTSIGNNIEQDTWIIGVYENQETQKSVKMCSNIPKIPEKHPRIAANTIPFHKGKSKIWIYFQNRPNTQNLKMSAPILEHYPSSPGPWGLFFPLNRAAIYFRLSFFANFIAIVCCAAFDLNIGIEKKVVRGEGAPPKSVNVKIVDLVTFFVNIHDAHAFGKIIERCKQKSRKIEKKLYFFPKKKKLSVFFLISLYIFLRHNGARSPCFIFQLCLANTQCIFNIIFIHIPFRKIDFFLFFEGVSAICMCMPAHWICLRGNL